LGFWRLLPKSPSPPPRGSYQVFNFSFTVQTSQLLQSNKAPSQRFLPLANFCWLLGARRDFDDQKKFTTTKDFLQSLLSYLQGQTPYIYFYLLLLVATNPIADYNFYNFYF